MSDLEGAPPWRGAGTVDSYVLNQMERRIAKLEADAEAREAARNERDQKLLVRGIMFLGAIVTMLGGIVWANLNTIIGK